jgi:hypothetical protein
LDLGKSLPFPDALLINGQKDVAVFTGEAGKSLDIHYVISHHLRP